MSEQQGPRPWPPRAGLEPSDHWDPAEAPLPAADGLSAEDAETSRRWRLVLGISSVVLGLASGFYAFTNIVAVVGATRAIEANGGYVPQGAMAMAVAIIAIFGVLALGYAVVGIWNIVVRQGTSAAPLAAAIVIAGIASILIVLYMVSAASIGLQAVGLALNALIIGRAIRLLRMKKAAAS